MWIVLRNSILIKDNLNKRGWIGNSSALFWGKDESIDHLFMKCSISRMFWNILKCAFNLLDIPDNTKALFDNWSVTFKSNE